MNKMIIKADAYQYVLGYTYVNTGGGDTPIYSQRELKKYLCMGWNPFYKIIVDEEKYYNLNMNDDSFIDLFIKTKGKIVVNL